MTHSEILAVLMRAGLEEDVARQVMCDLDSAMHIEPEIVDIEAHAVRVISPDSLM